MHSTFDLADAFASIISDCWMEKEQFTNSGYLLCSSAQEAAHLHMYSKEVDSVPYFSDPFHTQLLQKNRTVVCTVITDSRAVKKVDYSNIAMVYTYTCMHSNVMDILGEVLKN